MGNFRILIIAFLLALLLGCVQSTKETQEFINAPVNLTVASLGGTLYQLSFYSDNREGGFAGYGLFTGTSATALDEYPANDLTAVAAFCENKGQTNYKTTVAIQVGPTAAGVVAGTAICDLTGVTLASGSYVALRARVERTTKPWSSAAIAQVP